MPAIDKSSGVSEYLHSPANEAAAITPHDTNELTYVTRGIYVGGDGNIQLKTSLDQTVTFVGVKAGSILPVRAKLVLATNTTATNLVALW